MNAEYRICINCKDRLPEYEFPERAKLICWGCFSKRKVNYKNMKTKEPQVKPKPKKFIDDPRPEWLCITNQIKTRKWRR
jgi:hypothetical protein